MAELADGDLPDETDGTGVHNRWSRTDGSRKWTPLRYSKGGRRRQWRSQRRCARYAGQLRLGRGAKSGAGASPSSCGGRAREKTAGRKTEGEVHGAERSGELGHNSGERFPGRGSFSLLTEASTRCAKMSRRCGRDGGLNGELGRPGERPSARRGAWWLWWARGERQRGSAGEEK